MFRIIALTVAEKLGIAGFFLASGSLVWQGITWTIEHRVKLSIRIFHSSDDPSRITVEAVNKSQRQTVQVRSVHIERKGPLTVPIPTARWRDGPLAILPPGRIFQAHPAVSELAASDFPPPMQARGIVRIGDGKKLYRSRWTDLR